VGMACVEKGAGSVALEGTHAASHRAPEGDPGPAGHSLGSAFCGVIAPICTPFDAHEEVDYGALRFNLARYAPSGLLGYLVVGSNGENRSLTEHERLRVLGEVVRHRARGQLVLAGASYDAQRDAERFTAAAADLGADFALVLPPGYFRRQMSDEVLFRYFSSLADVAPIPVLLYNAPSFCGVTLDASLVSRLAEHPNIVGLKDSAPAGIEALLPLQGPRFAVLAGSATFLFRAMMAGSPGGTVSLANAFPAVALQLFAYGRARDEAAGIPFQERVSRLNAAISGRYGVPGVKAAMDLAGFRGGAPRRPLLPLAPGQVAELRERLIAEGLL
jgi:4-hydroxy-2-oxoglutarate aldolase